MSRKVQFDLDLRETFPNLVTKNGIDSEAQDLVADLIREEILSYVAEGNSPVSGYGKFPALSKDYREFKKDAGNPGEPNLEFNGDMLDALEVYPIKDGVIRVEIAGDQSDKADGHNNHSGDSTLPLRRFIPTKDETFKRDILSSVRAILEEYAD